MIYKDMKGNELHRGDSVGIIINPFLKIQGKVSVLADASAHIAVGDTAALATGTFKGFKTDVVHFHQLELLF